MLGAGNGGTVSVQLELFGVKGAESKLKRFERTVKNTFEKSKKEVRKFGTTLKTTLENSNKQFAKFSKKGKLAILAVFGTALVQGTRNAMKLERVILSLNRSLGANGGRAFKFATETAKKYGTGIAQTADSFSKFTAAATAANIPLKVQEDLFDAVTKSALTFGMTSEETRGAFQALQQMASKGVVSMEELRQQLGERVPIATAAAAKGLGVTQQELIKLVESGKLTAAEFFPALTRGLKGYSGGEVDTLAVQIGKLKTSWEELTTTLGRTVGVPVLDFLVRRTNEAIVNFEKLGKLMRIYGAGINNGFQVTGSTKADDNTRLALQQIELLEKKYGKYGLNTSGAIKAYMQASKQTKFGSQEAAVLSLDIAEKMTAETRKQQDAQQEGVKAIADQNKLKQVQKKIAEDNEKFQTEETKKREKFVLASIKKRIGTEAAAAYKAAEIGKKAAKELADARKGVDAAYEGDLTTNDGRLEVLKANAEYQRKSSAYLRTSSESAFAIQEAFGNAKQAAKDAADAVAQAKQSYAGILVDPQKGFGQYINMAGKKRRQEAGKQLLLNRAREIRSSALRSISNYDDRDSFARNTKLSTFSIQELQEFINNAGGELEAQRSLTKANEDLTKANHELSEVMKIAADNQVPLNESSLALNETINELVNKDWTVNVEVPGGSASGDVVMSIQNALQ